jgi:trimeric autotransporter adhesin
MKILNQIGSLMLFASLLLACCGVKILDASSLPAKEARHGIISTVAGGGISKPVDGIRATAAQLNNPSSIAVDSTGNIYIAETGNHRILKITTAGIIKTVAGNGTNGYGGDAGPASQAQLNNPNGVAVDSAGNLYISDGPRIRKVSTAGVISTVAGGGTNLQSDGGSATNALLNEVASIAVDSAGSLYISDGPRIRKVSAAGIISTVAGSGHDGYGGDGRPATKADLNFQNIVAVDFVGNIFIADINNFRIRKVSTAGIISTIAGNGREGYSGDGGPATAAQMSSSFGIAVDSMGNIYIADTGNNRIRKISTAGIISTAAGNGANGHGGDGGLATAAQLDWPIAISVDSTGNLYITDAKNKRIRKVTR